MTCLPLYNFSPTQVCKKIFDLLFSCLWKMDIFLLNELNLQFLLTLELRTRNQIDLSMWKKITGFDGKPFQIFEFLNGMYDSKECRCCCKSKDDFRCRPEMVFQDSVEDDFQTGKPETREEECHLMFIWRKVFSVNWIIPLLLSLLSQSKKILLSGGHYNI